MVRFSLLLVGAALVATGATGCTHCDTCDDFPVPCVGQNTSVPLAPAGSYVVGVGPDQTTIAPGPTTQPVPPSSPGPFAPGGGSGSSTPSALNSTPISGGSDSPPAPMSLGSGRVAN